jgi:thiamine pyrophosphokinase
MTLMGARFFPPDLGKFEKKIAFFVNGDFSDKNLNIKALQGSYVVAVDRGLLHVDALGLKPSMLVGDFDSLDPQLLEKYDGVPQLKLRIDKDETDLEAAIRAVRDIPYEYGAILAGFGGRSDHLMGHLQILARQPCRLALEGPQGVIFAISPQQGMVKIRTVPGQTVSFYPLGGEAEGILSRGLKWELNDLVLNGNFFSQSNIALGNEVEITVSEGILLCYLNT